MIKCDVLPPMHPGMRKHRTRPSRQSSCGTAPLLPHSTRQCPSPCDARQNQAALHHVAPPSLAYRHQIPPRAAAMLSGKAGVQVLLRTEKKIRHRRRHVPTRGGCCELAASAGNYGTGDETLPADARCVAPRARCSLRATGCQPRSSPASQNRPPHDLQRTSCVVLRTEGSHARPSIRSAPKRRCARLLADGSLHCRPAARRGA